MAVDVRKRRGSVGYHASISTCNSRGVIGWTEQSLWCIVADDGAAQVRRRLVPTADLPRTLQKRAPRNAGQPFRRGEDRRFCLSS